MICKSMDKVCESLDKMLVENIISLFKEEALQRKQAFKRWGIDSGYYCSDSNMQEVFLKAYAVAYNKMYGFTKVYGIDTSSESTEGVTAVCEGGEFINGGLSK